MVYKNIQLIRGVCLTLKQTLQFMNKVYEYRKINKRVNNRDDFDDNIHQFNLDIKMFQGIQIYTPRCCSKNKKYIIGFIMRTIRRIGVKCHTECGETYCCDRCIGETTDGWFDVDRILDSVVEIPDVDICTFCKKITNGDITDNTNKCNCNEKFMISHVSRTSLVFDKRIVPFFGDFEYGNYLWLDDCLYCT